MIKLCSVHRGNGITFNVGIIKGKPVVFIDMVMYSEPYALRTTKCVNTDVHKLFDQKNEPSQSRETEITDKLLC